MEEDVGCGVLDVFLKESSNRCAVGSVQCCLFGYTHSTRSGSGPFLIKSRAIHI